MRILIVEDNPIDKKNLEHAFASLPNSVLFWAGSLAEAIASKEKPEAIVLDLTLPDSQGVETVKAIQAAFPLTPIMVISGTDDHQTVIECGYQGACDFIVKNRVPEQQLAFSLLCLVGNGRRHREEKQDQRELRLDILKTLDTKLRLQAAP